MVKSIVFDCSPNQKWDIDKMKIFSSSPDYKETEELKLRKKVRVFISLRKMYPGAKYFCFNCYTPIFDEGECPNCDHPVMID